MNVICKPVKEIFKNQESNFRVISCVAVGQPPNELCLSNWGNFTLSGSNLDMFNMYEEYAIEIRQDNRSKYPASYIVVGFQGIDVGKEIKVDPKIEFQFLTGIMSYGQAINVHTAYPNFIELVLNNREAEIDYKNISNVGPVYLEKYIDEIKASYKSIFFMGITSEWEIKGDAKLEKLMKEFITPEEATQALEENPYRVLIDVVEYGFNTADAKIIEKMPHMIDSKERCEYGCLKVLKENETQCQCTRIMVSTAKTFLEPLVPEAYHHIRDVVKNSELIHYDHTNQYLSIKKTYDQEKFIADEILKRVKNSTPSDMDWEKFRSIDGFDCTDEQAEILKLVNNSNVMLLTGSAGTGKSSAMACFIKMLEHYMRTYVILAPTGVASKRIAQTTGRKASTIHMFLARLKDMFSSVEYVIVDEFSMVSVDLFAKLLNAVPNSKILMIGDEAQLASIQCGNLLYDLVNSGVVPKANLTKVFRYGIGGIATVATDVREGRPYLNGDNTPKFTAQVDDYKLLPIASKPENAVHQIIEVYQELLDRGYAKEDIMVLSPNNVNDIGTYRINEAIQTRFNPHVYTDIGYTRSEDNGAKYEIRFKIGDKVINTRNNYKSPVMEQTDDGLVFNDCEVLIANGDIGFIRATVHDEELGDYLVVQYDEYLIGVIGDNIYDLLLGYAITIHKSQGSQSKAVIMITHRMQKNMIKRNLLYVGASRAQEYLYQISDVKCINAGLEVQEEMERDTWLMDMLKEGI